MKTCLAVGGNVILFEKEVRVGDMKSIWLEKMYHRKFCSTHENRNDDGVQLQISSAKTDIQLQAFYIFFSFPFIWPTFQ